MIKKNVAYALIGLVFSSHCSAVIQFGNSSAQFIDIQISDLSSGEKLDYTDSTVSLCSTTNNATVTFSFSEIPLTSGDFTVLPIGGAGSGQDYTLDLEPKDSSQRVDPVVKQTPYPVSFNSACNAAKHDAKLHLNFKNLGTLPAGHYESLLQVAVSGQSETIDIPVRLRNGDQVQITNLEDLVLSDTGSEWSASNPNICVYNSTGSYALEARSKYYGRLKNAQGSGGDYRIFWKAGAGGQQEITDQLTANSGDLQGLSASLKLNCAASETAEVSIVMTGTVAGSLLAGVYQDTVTLTVRAM